ncbi:MAG TPA: DUF6134 family protein [Alphaproteobacteria bacterium]|nr:DUF6134 family protein [Alphaproteobacteria bacterium]
MRRRFLALAAAATSAALLESLPSLRAYAAPQTDLRFRALHRGSQVGEHRVTFRQHGDRLIVGTQVDITIKILFFTAFRFKHRAEEIWQSKRLVSVRSTTDDNGTTLQVSGYAAKDGFRMLGNDGPFLASAHLLTSNSLWNSGIVHESRLIDVQHGSEIGLVVKLLGDEQVDTPQGPVRASRYQLITPHYAGSVFYESNGRWVKGLIEEKGEVIEYALAF